MEQDVTPELDGRSGDETSLEVDEFSSSSRGAKFLSDSVVTYATELLCAVLNLGTSVLVARILGPSGRGVYAVLVLIPVTMQHLGNLGLAQGVVHYLRKDPEGRGRRAANLIVAGALIGVPMALLAYFGLSAGWLEATRVAPEFVRRVIVFCVPLMLFNGYAQGYALAIDDLVKRNLLRLMELGAYLIAVVILLVGLDRGLEGAVLAWACGVVATSILGLAFLLPEAAKTRFLPDVARFKLDLTFGLQGYVASLSGFLLYRADQYLVAYFLDSASVGHYSVAAALMQVILILPIAIDQAFLPKVTAQYAESGGQEAMTPVVSRLSILVTGIITVIMALGAYPMLYLLYGVDYLPAVGALLVLLAMAPLTGSAVVIMAALQARAAQIWNSGAALAGFAANFLLDLFLIPTLGIEGAALGSCIAYGVTLLVLGKAFTRIDTHVSLGELFIPRRTEWDLLVRALKSMVGKALKRS